MKRSRTWMVTIVALSVAGVLSGCNTSSVPQTKSPSPADSNSANQAASNSTPTPSSTPSPTSNHSGFGWYYINLSSFGKGTQIAGVNAADGQLEMTAEKTMTTSGQFQQVYMSAPVQQSSWTVGTVQPSSQPSSYTGPWSLKFGKLQYTKPITITLTDHGKDVYTLPSSVPGYAAEIMTDPAPFDNQVIGQSGNWVWIAMKGPQSAPFAYIASFRHWSRIVAVNTQTDTVQVFSIPPNTSKVSTANDTPAFAQHGQYVYIGTGPWLGVLPVDPTTGGASVVHPEPKSAALTNQDNMLTGLQHEAQAGANGLATFWNGYVMEGNQKDNVWAWQMQPIVWNHGGFPSSVNWAVRFPLKQGSSVYQTRAKLYAEIKMLLSNPLDTAPIVYDTRNKLKQHFHSVPPAPVPGYTIKGGYYVKNGATGG